MPTRLAPYSRPLVDRFPGLRAYSRRIRFAQWRSKMAIRSGLRRARIDPVRLLWVDPRKITDVCVGIDWATYDKAHELGRIVGGDWDLNTMPFEHLDVYQAIRARFVHGARWEDTGYYKSLLARLEYGERPWPFRSKDDLPRRLQELDALVAAHSEQGHRAQRQCPDNRYWHQ